MEPRGRGPFVVLLLLTVAAGAALVTEYRAGRRRDARSEQFQHLVGGLGFGPALDLSGCAFAFDPRLDGGSAEENGPTLGGACFCPGHAGSVFYYARLRQGQSWPAGEADETPP